MKKLVVVVIMGAGVLVGGVSPVRAQGSLDHLMCYRMRDPLQVQNAVDMIAELQPDFSQKGCVLIRPAEFCVPASKENVRPAPSDPSIVGQPLQNDYVCYTAQCPDQPLPSDKVVADQFGERVERNFRPARICVPARKRALSCGNTPDGMCGGTCQRPGDQCQVDATGVCACKPARCRGSVDDNGICGGSCRDPNLRCLPGKDSECRCQPPPPPPCGMNPAAGVCGGSCANPMEQCLQDAAGVCACQTAPTSTPTPSSPPCGPVSAGPCGGTCVDAAGVTGQCEQAPGATQCQCVPLR